MSVYHLIVRIPQAGNKEFDYSVTLNKLHESYPEDYFRVEDNRLNLCRTIQESATRQVSPASLEAIISKWISEIKCGIHHTTVTLDLPSESVSPPEQVVTPPVTDKVKNSEVTAKPKQPRPVTPPPTPKDTIPETSPPDIRADTNKADF